MFQIFNKLKKLTQTPKRAFSKVLIKNGTVVNSDRKFRGEVYIDGGKIVNVTENDTITVGSDVKVIDAAGQYIIPGGIDTHVHLQLPFMGTNAIDDFNIGSKAALTGGTTSFIDFVIPGKGQSIIEAYDTWRGWADPKVHCDYALHCAITDFNDQTSKEMAQLVQRGVQSFQTFSAYKDVLMLDDSQTFQTLVRSKELGAIVLTHCENGELIIEGQKKMKELGILGPEAHYLSRPELVEAEATHRVITIADLIGAPLYIVHVMSKQASEEVMRAQNRGNILFAETLAAAIGADGRQIFDKNWEIAAGHVMSPPINPDPTTGAHLMKYLHAGHLNTVATDNCTFCLAQQQLGEKDFSKIPNGVCGIEDRLSVLWTQAVDNGFLSPMDFVKVTSTAAAQIFNMYPNKGIIRAGADADVVVWNPKADKVISAQTHHQAVDFNVFEGMRVTGTADVTITGGRVVWENGKFNSKPGSGRYYPREPFGYAFERVQKYDEYRDPRQLAVDRTNNTETKEQNSKLAEDLQSKIKILEKTYETLDSRYKELKTEYERVSTDPQTLFDEQNNLISAEKVFQTYLPQSVKDEIFRIFYGKNCNAVKISDAATEFSKKYNFQIQSYSIPAQKEQLRAPRIVQIAAIQNRIVQKTTAPVAEQAEALRQRVAELIEGAYLAGANVVCLQECWNTPFFMCTRERTPWIEFAEYAENSEGTRLLCELAKKFNMVIISPILERDEVKETIHNAAVVIDNHGTILGKQHKIHIPRVGDFNESTYYMEGDTGHPVFETEFGRIGINICYGRHHFLHWMGFGLNGAEIVFNPSATVGGLSEPLWPIEARHAAITNHMFTVGINRIGTERYPNEFTSGDGLKAHHEFGHFYGSSYISAPDGTRTPGLSRVNDGVLVSEIDLNMCRQVRDKWGFTMTGRHSLYAKLLNDYIKPDFQPQIVRRQL